MSQAWKRIGIVGGLGPLACAHFYVKLVEMTAAGSDQDHPEVVIISDPAIPNRIGHLLGRGSSPVPGLRSVLKRLEQAGAELIAMPSVTTQAYRSEVAGAVGVPVVDMLTATACGLDQAGVRRPAVVVTSVTRQLGHLDTALTAAGLHPVYPGAAVQQEIQSVVDLAKSGRREEGAARLADVLHRSWTAPGDGMLIGCTDLSPLARAEPGLHDVNSIFARAVLDLAAAP
jgi:aspartate racemase